MTPRFFKLLKTRLTVSRATPAKAARSFPADPLVEQNASATRVLADIVREFEQSAGNTAPHRQEARGGQGLVGFA